MSDDPFYTPGLKLPPRQRRPGELQWTVRKDHVTWTCELKFHGESYGWECQIFRGGDLRWGRRFLLRQEAIGFAEAERRAIEKGGV